jgi:Glyoxalase-like domain
VPAFIKSVSFDCADALLLARFWAAALGSDVDEESTADKAFVEAPGWGGPNIWFTAVPEPKTAKNRMHFDLRAPGGIPDEVRRLTRLGASVLREGTDLVVLADPEDSGSIGIGEGEGPTIVVMQDPEGNEFCVE